MRKEKERKRKAREAEEQAKAEELRRFYFPPAVNDDWSDQQRAA